MEKESKTSAVLLVPICLSKLGKMPTFAGFPSIPTWLCMAVSAGLLRLPANLALQARVLCKVDENIACTDTTA